MQTKNAKDNGGAAESQPTLRTTNMSYDRRGRKVTMDDPDMGDWSYQYNTAGGLIRQRDARGQVLCFYYDRLSRLETTAADSTPATPCTSGGPGAGDVTLATYTYDTAANGDGQLARVGWAPNPTTNYETFAYDGEGRLATHGRVINGRSYTLAIPNNGYDLLDRPLTMTTPFDETVTRSYDHEGENSLLAGTDSLIDGVGWTARGQLAYLARPNAPDTALGYHDATNNFRLSVIRHGTDASDALPDFHYTGYDDVGRITGMQIKISGDTQNQAFTYDALDRLTSAVLTNAAGGSYGSYDHDYVYNELGNLTSVQRNGNVRNYAYTDTHHKQAVTALTGDMSRTFVYDANGNMTERRIGGSTTWKYSYDAQNRLVQVKQGTQQTAPTTTFTYDANGQRVSTTYPDGTKVYTLFSDYEEEVAPGGATTRRSTYRLAGHIVAVRVQGSTPNYTYFDHPSASSGQALGSISAYSNFSGTYVANSLARYEPYGEFRNGPPASNPTISDRGFTGHRHNNTGNNTALIYMNARYYLPETGRFISADTIVPDPQNPRSHNRYSYVRNNPINLTDPTGHRECAINCSGERVGSQETRFGSNWYGPWDIEQQAVNSARAEAAGMFFLEVVAGLWEPTDWAVALNDGFQWYDTIGFFPLIPATVGRHLDNAEYLVNRVESIHKQIHPLAQKRRTTAMLLAKDQNENLHHLVASSEPVLNRAQQTHLLPGEIPIDGPAKMHAEVKLIFAAEERGLTPLMVVASRPICPDPCARLIAEYSIIPVTPLKLVKRR